jgi:hypothetical protein
VGVGDGDAVGVGVGVGEDVVGEGEGVDGPAQDEINGTDASIPKTRVKAKTRRNAFVIFSTFTPPMLILFTLPDRKPFPRFPSPPSCFQ